MEVKVQLFGIPVSGTREIKWGVAIFRQRILLVTRGIKKSYHNLRVGHHDSLSLFSSYFLIYSLSSAVPVSDSYINIRRRRRRRRHFTKSHAFLFCGISRRTQPECISLHSRYFRDQTGCNCWTIACEYARAQFPINFAGIILHQS